MKTTLLLCSMLIAGSLNAQTFAWANQIGGIGDTDNGMSVTTDAQGNVYATGQFEGTVDFDPGADEFLLTAIDWADMFVCKYAPTGQLVWAVNIGGGAGAKLTRGHAIAVSPSGHLYITGLFSDLVDFDPGPNTVFLETVDYCDYDYDLFILKLTTDGEFEWVKQIGAPDGRDVGYTIALGPQEEIYIGGQVASNSNAMVDFDPGAGIYELPGSMITFLLKLDSAGQFLWVDQFISRCGETFGSCGFRDNRTDINALAVDAGGQAYITGQFNCYTDFDPGEGIMILDATGPETFVVKLSAAGALIWAREFNGSGNSGHGIAVDGNGNVHTSGWYEKTVDFDPSGGIKNLKSVAGTPDVFVSKLDMAGNYIWAVSMGGSGNDWGFALDLDASGNVYTAGIFTGTGDYNPGQQKFNLKSAGDRDIFVSKLTSSSGFAWAVRMGGPGKETCNDLDVDVSNGVCLTGEFELTADFDPSSQNYTLTSHGFEDAYVTKLDQQGGQQLIQPGSDLPYDIMMSVFPNPTGGMINVQFDWELENGRVELYNLNGQLLIEENNVMGRSKQLDLSAFESGVYLLRMDDGRQSSVVRIYKE